MGCGPRPTRDHRVEEMRAAPLRGGWEGEPEKGAGSIPLHHFGGAETRTK